MKKEMCEKVVKIKECDSLYVERLFYLSNSRKENIRFLMCQQDINKKLLDDYIKQSDEINIELELAKKETAQKYKPLELNGKDFNYAFNFDDDAIRYQYDEIK